MLRTLSQRSTRNIWWLWILVLLAVSSLPALGFQAAQPAPVQRPSEAKAQLELSRPARPWEFLDAVGTRAGVLGAENGTFEAWVYPLKIFRDFKLVFHFRDRSLPAEAFARTVTVRPEATSLLYSGDTFSVLQTWFVPLDESGAIVRLEIETREPLQIEAVFVPDFQLMWPASLGGTYSGWDEKLHAFRFGHEQRKAFGILGSPAATRSQEAFVFNYATSTVGGFMLPKMQSGKQTQLIALAGSVESQEKAEQTYQNLLKQSASLETAAAQYYRDYLQRTVRLELPDADLQKAYEWSLISMLQGVVKNPYLGTGLIAGYRTSGTTQRPGFAWFFGRDALWTVLALNSAGDFSTSRTALDFLSKYQRDDGKIEHEISQSATLVPWFKEFPYGYASADATPLYIIAMRDYATSSGDAAFVKEKWESIWKAYQFLRSTWDANGMPQNLNVGHGWVEGGPLLPVRTELYQAGLGTEALRALAELARMTAQPKIAYELEQIYPRQRSRLNQIFWSAEKRLFAFAIDTSDRLVEIPSVLATVPMWFDLLEEKQADQMISVLADYDHAADWGMRIISSQDPKYDPSGYHFGSVWPLFTGWAAVGEYKSHRPTPAYANLQANAQLALDGSPGDVTEVLSGDYYVGLSTSSPHQIWSSAMVVSPLLRGLLGLDVSSLDGKVMLAPHVPAGWRQFAIDNVRVGKSVLDFHYQQSDEEILLRVERRGAAEAKELIFAPAVSLITQATVAEVNNRAVKFFLRPSPSDGHVQVRVPLGNAQTTVRIRLRNSFALENSVSLPALGAKSRNLKIADENWRPNAVRLQLSGIAGQTYELEVFGSAKISSVQGAELLEAGGKRRLRVSFPAGAGETYVKKTVDIQFAAMATKDTAQREKQTTEYAEKSFGHRFLPNDGEHSLNPPTKSYG